MIKNSLEWSRLEQSLKSRTRGLSHGRDIIKMIDNIRKEITELSREEVNLRCGKKHSTDKILIKINEDIQMVEEYILIAKLLG
jgi:hypothetical protein